MLVVISNVQTISTLQVGTLVEFDGYQNDGIHRKGIVSKAWNTKKRIPVFTLYRNKQEKGYDKKIEARCYTLSQVNNLRVLS